MKGIIYSFKGDVRRSLELNKKAYELVKDTDNIVLIGSSLNNIGFNYFYLKEFDKAIEYSKKALKIHHDPGLAFPLGNLIEIYLRKGEIKEAKVYYDQLRDLKEKNDTKLIEARYKIGNIYEQKGDKTKALAKYKEIINNYKRADNTEIYSKAEERIKALDSS